MRRMAFIVTCALVVAAAGAVAQSGPYKVLKTAKVGGEGGWDYIYADAGGRRLYIPRGAATPGASPRLTIFNLDTLAPVGEIDGVGGHGTAVDPKSGHGFVSGKPITMFDTKTMKVIKTIDPGAAAPDGILFDAFNDRVYIFSHPTKDATAIDAKDGARPRHDRSGRRARGRRGRRQGHALRRHAGRGGRRHLRRREDDEGRRAPSVRRHRTLQRPRARREERRALRRVRAVGESAGRARRSR